MSEDEFRRSLQAKKAALAAKNTESESSNSDRAGAEDEPFPEGGEDAQATQSPKQRVDEGELMATAFEALSTGSVNIEWERVQVVQEKAQPAPLDAAPHPPAPPAPAPQTSPAPSQPRLDPAQWQGRSWAGQDFFSGQTDQISSQHPFSRIDANQLDPDQKRLLDKIGQLPPDQVQELQLRHLSRSDAMQQMRRQVAQMRLFGQRYLRVITGKGIGSSGAPILRQEVIHWCILQAKRQALQWTPELEKSGEYGAIFVDLQGQGTPT